MNPNVNYQLCVIMMCQCRFINCNKCPLCWGTLIAGEAVCGGGQQDLQEISVLGDQFCCERKTALKSKVNF